VYYLGLQLACPTSSTSYNVVPAIPAEPVISGAAMAAIESCSNSEDNMLTAKPSVVEAFDPLSLLAADLQESFLKNEQNENSLLNTISSTLQTLNITPSTSKIQAPCTCGFKKSKNDNSKKQQRAGPRCKNCTCAKQGHVCTERCGCKGSCHNNAAKKKFHKIMCYTQHIILRTYKIMITALKKIIYN
jgi:hypothetical protein